MHTFDSVVHEEKKQVIDVPKKKKLRTVQAWHLLLLYPEIVGNKPYTQHTSIEMNSFYIYLQILCCKS